MLIFAAVFILVLYDSCHKPKKRCEEIVAIAGQDTVPRAAFTVINRDGRQNDTLMLFRQRTDTTEIKWDVHGYIENNSVVVCYWPSASNFGDSAISYADPRNLKVKLVAGRREVESALPVRIKLKNGHLENDGDSIAIPKIEWRVEKKRSEVAQCSVVVKKYYETPDSSTVIYFENPNSLHKRFMSEIKPFRPKMEMPPDIVSEAIDTSRAPLFESNYPALEAKGQVRSMLDPHHYNKVVEWPPEEIIADQKWLDSFFARLDSVLADTTKKKNND